MCARTDEVEFVQMVIFGPIFHLDAKNSVTSQRPFMHLVVKFDVPDAKFSYFCFLVARVVHFVVVVDVFRSRGLVVESDVLSSHVAKIKAIKWRDALDCARSSARPPLGASVLARLPQHEAEFLQADRPSKRY